MKKLLALILAVLMMACLCACGGDNTETPNTDNKPQSSQSETSSKEEVSKFTVTVVDQNGDAVVGAMVQICDDENCLMPLPTDDNGKVQFNFESSDSHKVLLASCPDGYETEYMGENYLYIEDGETEFTFEITKK